MQLIPQKNVDQVLQSVDFLSYLLKNLVRFPPGVKLPQATIPDRTSSAVLAQLQQSGMNKKQLVKWLLTHLLRWHDIVRAQNNNEIPHLYDCLTLQKPASWANASIHADKHPNGKKIHIKIGPETLQTYKKKGPRYFAVFFVDPSTALEDYAGCRFRIGKGKKVQTVDILGLLDYFDGPFSRKSLIDAYNHWGASVCS
jgi:hypothetical protein